MTLIVYRLQLLVSWFFHRCMCINCLWLNEQASKILLKPFPINSFWNKVFWKRDISLFCWGYVYNMHFIKIKNTHIIYTFSKIHNRDYCTKDSHNLTLQSLQCVPFDLPFQSDKQNQVQYQLQFLPYRAGQLIMQHREPPRVYLLGLFTKPISVCSE